MLFYVPSAWAVLFGTLLIFMINAIDSGQPIVFVKSVAKHPGIHAEEEGGAANHQKVGGRLVSLVLLARR